MLAQLHRMHSITKWTQSLTIHLPPWTFFYEINGDKNGKLYTNYSYLPNIRGGLNKRGGWKNCQNRINGEGVNIPNNRGGWNFSITLLKGEGEIFPKIETY